MISFFKVLGRSLKLYSEEGEFVLALSYFLSHPRVGDIVVVRHPAKHILLLKRILRIQNNIYWVQGDNKDQSSDSRDFGWISRDFILGKAKIIQNRGFPRVGKTASEVSVRNRRCLKEGGSGEAV